MYSQRNNIIEYNGTLYIFNEKFEYDQLWFIVKVLENKQNNVPLEDIISLSKIWKCKKNYKCHYPSEVENELQNVLHLITHHVPCTLQVDL